MYGYFWKKVHFNHLRELKGQIDVKETDKLWQVSGDDQQRVSSLHYQHILKQEGKKSKENNQQWAAFESMPDSWGQNYQKCITDTAENL